MFQFGPEFGPLRPRPTEPEEKFTLLTPFEHQSFMGSSVAASDGHVFSWDELQKLGPSFHNVPLILIKNPHSDIAEIARKRHSTYIDNIEPLVATSRVSTFRLWLPDIFPSGQAANLYFLQVIDRPTGRLATARNTQRILEIVLDNIEPEILKHYRPQVITESPASGLYLERKEE